MNIVAVVFSVSVRGSRCDAKAAFICQQTSFGKPTVSLKVLFVVETDEC